MRKFYLLSSLMMFVMVLRVRTSPSLSQASSAYDAIAAVSDFRIANGPALLQSDPIFLSIAQAHSAYQASIGTDIHTGPGDSSPKGWASAAGFGGGASIFFLENIIGGNNLSIQKAICKFWQDEAHLNTMLNPPSSVNLSNPSKNNTNSGPTATAYDAFIVSTPREDGAIIHVVGDGQSLIGIAKAYDVPLNEILALNNFSLDTIIYPNEEIIIQVRSPPTATISPTATRPTATASVTATQSTPTPRGTFTPNPTASPTATATPTPIPTGRERLVTGVVVMALIILVAVIASGLLAGRAKDR